MSKALKAMQKDRGDEHLSGSGFGFRFWFRGSGSGFAVLSA
jgi:hypothetical protein